MQNIKGSALISVIDYAKENNIWQKALDDLTPENRTTLSDTILPSQWYSLEDYIKLLEIVAKHAGGDPDVGISIGRKIISDGLKKYYKIIMGILSAKYILSKAPVLWKNYFNSEVLSILDVGDKHLNISVSDQSNSIRINKVYCLSVLGGMLQTIETVGGKNIRVDEVHCRCNNESACEYHITWD